MKVRIYFMVVGLVLGFAGGLSFRKEPPVSTLPSLSVSDYLPEPEKEIVPEVIYQNTGSHTILIDSVPYPVPFPLPVDSAKIAKDYLVVRNYQIDTTANDVRLVFNQNIYANRVLNYDFELYNLKNCNKSAKNALSIGILTGQHEISPILAYKHKRLTYMAGYNLYGNNIRVGILYTLQP